MSPTATTTGSPGDVAGATGAVAADVADVEPDPLPAATDTRIVEFTSPVVRAYLEEMTGVAVQEPPPGHRCHW